MLGNGLYMLFKWVVRIIWLIIRQIIQANYVVFVTFLETFSENY